jgi:hypothetical protein
MRRQFASHHCIRVHTGHALANDLGPVISLESTASVLTSVRVGTSIYRDTEKD